MFFKKKAQAQSTENAFDSPANEVSVPSQVPTMKIYKDRRKGWRWSFRAGNGKVMADSAESYISKRNARQAAERVIALVPHAEIDQED